MASGLAAAATDYPTAAAGAFQRELADQAFSRAAGAPLVAGNDVEILRDAAENYPAWERSIRAARHHVHVEMYILCDDAAGQAFAEVLLEKAREGVAVRLLYDWMGALGKTPARFWRRLREGGVDVRCCNPPRLDAPLGWIRRDHRKVVAVDGDVAYVSGLCIGQDWLGSPERGIEAWRDTGLSIRGPAVAQIGLAFAEVWRAHGQPLPESEVLLPPPAAIPGGSDLRIIATSPETSGLFRLDLLWAAMARERLWITDAYFVGTRPYLDALEVAARSAVDVRLLVPSTSDIAPVAALSRTQYRSLLRAGVRVFEWNGSMIHAKSAVVDGHWGRVGSTNLNFASWMGNWELDVCIEDDRLAREMEDDFERDLAHATEIVLSDDRVVNPPPQRSGHRGRLAPGSASRVAAAAVELSGTVGAVITRRSLGATETRPVTSLGLTMLALAGVCFLVPAIIAFPLGALAAWVGIALLGRALAAVREARRARVDPGGPPDDRAH